MVESSYCGSASLGAAPTNYCGRASFGAGASFGAAPSNYCGGASATLEHQLSTLEQHLLTLEQQIMLDAGAPVAPQIGYAGIEWVEPAPAIYIGPDGQQICIPPAWSSAADTGVELLQQLPQATSAAAENGVETENGQVVSEPAAPVIEFLTLNDQALQMLGTAQNGPTVEFVTMNGAASSYPPGTLSAIEYVEPAPAVYIGPAPAVPTATPTTEPAVSSAVAGTTIAYRPGPARKSVTSMPAPVEYTTTAHVAAEYVVSASERRSSMTAATGGELEIPIEYVSINGSAMPILLEHHLQSLQPAHLRELVTGLHTVLGGHQLGINLPLHDHELIPWMLGVQRVFLEPLPRSASQ